MQFLHGRDYQRTAAFAQPFARNWETAIRSGLAKTAGFDNIHPALHRAAILAASAGKDILLFLNPFVLTSQAMKLKALDILDRLQRSGASKEDRLPQRTMI
jgi:hypothetical protein